MSTITETASKVLLPDLPGKVHGIKSKGSPWAVQCDDCLTVFAGVHLILVAQRAVFNRRSSVPGLRLCSDCWAERGWTEDYWGWNYGEPKEVHP